MAFSFCVWQLTECCISEHLQHKFLKLQNVQLPQSQISGKKSYAISNTMKYFLRSGGIYIAFALYYCLVRNDESCLIAPPPETLIKD